MRRRCLFEFLAFFVVLKIGHGSFLEHVNPHSTPRQQSSAVVDIIQYFLGNNSGLFSVEIDSSFPRNTFSLFKDPTQSVVSIRGDSGVSASRGFYFYVERYCNGHISWDGEQLNFFDERRRAEDLPNVNLTWTSTSYFTYYQNVCTWSYSFAWWGWEEWQRHIYWMALQGINLALAPFQELTWKEIYLDLGMSEEEIREHLGGPAFLAWQRMGNVRGWGGPLSDAFMERNSELQKKIIQLSNDLGISLALPTFAGHVPLAFKRIFPNATFTPVVRWNRFEDRFCCPLFLDPTDPLFNDIAGRFLRKIIATYGTNHIYFADPFNEINPARNETDYMRSVSRGIFNSMQEVDEKAIWLLQGWMFVKNPFWGDELIESFLTAVPRGRILVLDLQSDQLPQYERTKSYYGQPYIWCMLHNFGGTLDMHGSFTVLNERPSFAKRLANSTMVGMGITPEGIFQNYIMYDFALKQAWFMDKWNLTEWIEDYSVRRYGVDDSNIKSAMQLMRSSAYSYIGLDKISGKYAVCRRPSPDFDSMTWYENSVLEEAWENLLDTKTNLDSDLYLMDLVDLTRQALQNRGEEIYTVIIQAYEHQELEGVEAMAEQFIELLSDMDRILATHRRFLLGRWLEAAKALATTEEERDQLETNARAQITTWGPSGEIIDYATKQWSGMFNDFFAKRWTLFFNELTKVMRSNRKLNKRKVMQKILYSVEIPFLSEKKLYPTEVSGEDPRTVAKELYDKWANNFLSNLIVNETESVTVYLVP